MGSCGPIGGGGQVIASSCGTAVTQNEKTQEMDHTQSRPWTALLRRSQGHHGDWRGQETRLCAAQPQRCTNVWKSGRKWAPKLTRAGRTGCGERFEGRAEE